MRRFLSLFLVLFILMMSFTNIAHADEKVLNVYGWTAEIPDEIIEQFERIYGIKVNFSTYENNEIMYAKLKAVKSPGYDIVMPSSYYVDRMRRQGMLEKLDKNQLPNIKNLYPQLADTSYDPHSNYSIPHLWGITGIYYNKKDYPPNTITSWNDLWDKKYRDQLMLLDDTREIFSMGLLSLGYSANDSNPAHIKAAYLKLKALIPNARVFASDMVPSIMADEDAPAGMAWNGDAFKASADNPDVAFVFPKEGFVIWVDTFAILKNAPHKKEAYEFINYMLRADIAKVVAIETRYSTANAAAQKLLPPDIRNNPTVYPSQSVVNRGEFQTDLSDDTLALYEKYWEALKMGG